MVATISCIPCALLHCSLPTAPSRSGVSYPWIWGWPYDLLVTNRRVLYDFWGHKKRPWSFYLFLLEHLSFGSSSLGLFLSEASHHAVKRPCVGVLVNSPSWAQSLAVPGQVPESWMRHHHGTKPSSPSYSKLQLLTSLPITWLFPAEGPDITEAEMSSSHMPFLNSWSTESERIIKWYFYDTKFGVAYYTAIVTDSDR